MAVQWKIFFLLLLYVCSTANLIHGQSTDTITNSLEDIDIENELLKRQLSETEHILSRRRFFEGSAQTFDGGIDAAFRYHVINPWILSGESYSAVSELSIGLFAVIKRKFQLRFHAGFPGFDQFISERSGYGASFGISAGLQLGQRRLTFIPDLDLGGGFLMSRSGNNLPKAKGYLALEPGFALRIHINEVAAVTTRPYVLFSPGGDFSGAGLQVLLSYGRFNYRKSESSD